MKPSPSSPGATGIDSASLLNKNSKSHKFSSKVKFELQTILFQFFTFHIPLMVLINSININDELRLLT